MSVSPRWKSLAAKHLANCPPELAFLGAVVLAACVARMASLLSPFARHDAEQKKGSKKRSASKCKQGGGAGERDASTIRVCFSVDITANWREVVAEYERTSILPNVQLVFGVLVECDDVNDVRLHSADDMRGTVAISHAVPIKKHEKIKAARRLVRRFVNGMETLIVLVDHRVRPEVGWDETLMWCGLPLDGKSFLTCPVSANDDPAFPTIRQRSSGAAARSDERVFRNPDLRRRDVVPSACWCAELLAAPPNAMLAWCASKGRGTEFCYFVPSFSFLRRSARHVVEEVIVENEECPLLLGHAAAGKDAVVSGRDRVGLSRAPTSLEMRRKFGSVDAARIAVAVESNASK